MYDVVALGELLIDFTPIDISAVRSKLDAKQHTMQHAKQHAEQVQANTKIQSIYFEQNAGGAPANVLTACCKWGKRTAMIAKIGEDQFGQFLRNSIKLEGIDDVGLVQSKTIPTTLAFVHLQPDGERSFTFYRNPGADVTLMKDDINVELIKQSRIFHFGSLSLTADAVREATWFALEVAKQEQKIISYDPNLREQLWSSKEEAKIRMLEGLHYADIVKVSEEELYFLTNNDNAEDASKQLFEQYQLSLLFVTRGAEGCIYKAARYYGEVPSFAIDAVDTTAAGDSFFGTILAHLADCKDITQLDETEIRKMITLANAMGALTATKKGAMTSIPSCNELMAFMRA